MKALALLALFATQSAPQAKPVPEVFEKLKVLVGEEWTGNVSETVTVKMVFRQDSNDREIIGEGTVGDPKKPMLKIRTTMGIDPKTGEVFYLDCHNGNTVYLGKVTLVDGAIQMDFKSLTGEPGHWVSEIGSMTETGYASTLYGVGSDGKRTKMHTLEMKRAKK